MSDARIRHFGNKLRSALFVENVATQIYDKYKKGDGRNKLKLNVQKVDPDKKKKRIEATNQFYNRWFDVKI